MDDVIATIDVRQLGRGRYSVHWDERFSREPVGLWASTAGAEFASAESISDAALPGVEVALESAARAYFQLQRADGQQLVAAARAVAFNGAVNFRDLGGYATNDGRRVKWGRLFRSGHLVNLDAADKRAFSQLGVTTVCDFRMAEEAAEETAELPGEPDTHVLGIPPGIGDKNYFRRLFAATDQPSDVVAAMHDMMVCLVRESAPYYRGLFEVLLKRPSGAVLMNCSAGKERTGIASVLLLSALGVPRETIMYDFMLSGRYFPAEAEVPRVLKKYGVALGGDAGRALIMPLLEARPSYLEAAFAAIDDECGGSAAFLQKHYGLDDAACKQLRDLYTG